MDDLPPKDSRPMEDDLQKAEACLKGVPLKIFPSQVNYYKAQYYLALSDLHLWRQQYPEAIFLHTCRAGMCIRVSRMDRMC